ncbi:hypothetical protein NUU61_007759 [Penicillium alfredii]|uniref:Uncharacterized protein n=1 Tax=Penicillium alfredii TaxID=1506179 RepID=A0A9W9ER32_9EURO|nr:uncharacterized protein NUU61_007759 [Penicillium alfredii]KAJ5086452.1 hypothetical protein NUU61_007759 [Penicillium alfredii]
METVGWSVAHQERAENPKEIESMAYDAENTMDIETATVIAGLQAALTRSWLQDYAISSGKTAFVEKSFFCPEYQPPPSYDDAIHDLPPEYLDLPPSAQRKTPLAPAAPAAPGAKSRGLPSMLWKDRTRDVDIDFEILTGLGSWWRSTTRRRW